MQRNTDRNGAELDHSRQTIDQCDREIVRLLAERMEAVRSIAEYKREHPDAPLRDENRERQLHDVWARAAAGHDLSAYFAGRVLREILNWSRREQERFLTPVEAGSRISAVRVGFQGVPACYSDLAITKLFSTRGAGRLQRAGFRTFTAAIDALEAEEIDYALLPIENTIAGSINEVYDLLSSRKITIVGEEILEVEHCLVALPGTSLEDVEVIRSHPVALQQCNDFLDKMVGTVAESWHDTAGAARSVAVEKSSKLAAIASEEAAQHYGLEVLCRGISDTRSNKTRFLLIAREPEPADPRLPAKTSLLISVNHRRGALLECLKAFSSHGINLSKLESRPQPDSPWEYLFYMDVEGAVEDADVAAALAELRDHTNRLKVLGTYARCPREDEVLELPLPGSAAEPQVAADLPVDVVQTCALPEPAPVAATAKRRLVDPRPDGGRTTVSVGGVEFGGERFVLIAGPCAVESREQVLEAAAMVRRCGASLLRGGAFKPRSSPYSFQGLGFPGLDLLVEAGHAYEMPVVTEVLEVGDVQRIAEKSDMLQVGARNMQNFALLREVGRIDRPVLLKRGMSATISELLMAAEYIMAAGNNRVVLCERGIRTFETATRATLDVSAVPVLLEKTHLPVIVDPSHAAGVRALVKPLALAAAAAGAHGLIVEAHPHPDAALCDKDQALTSELLEGLVHSLRPIVAAMGRKL